MTRSEFRRRIDTVSKRPGASQRALTVLQGLGLVSTVRGRRFRPFSPVEMAWILFLITAEGTTVYAALRVAEQNPAIIPAIAQALEAGTPVEVGWWSGAGIRSRMTFPADLIRYVTNQPHEQAQKVAA
jgi:hypothetical protein